MATTNELALLSEAVYGAQYNDAIPPYWTQIDIKYYGKYFPGNSGFQGALYGHISGVGADGKYIYDQITIAIRGTEPIMLFTDIRNDFQIMGQSTQFAQQASLDSFYTAIEATLPTLNLTTNVTKYITGQSLGGTLAELLGASTGIETVTFEAFGAENFLSSYLSSIGATTSYSSNIKNYVVANDFVGNYYLDNHIGEVKLLYPVPLKSTGLGALEPHNYIPFGFAADGISIDDLVIQTGTTNWSREKALALWFYDKTMDPVTEATIESVLSITKPSLSVLESAVEYIESVGKHPFTLTYDTGDGYYIIGDDKGLVGSGTLMGSIKNDTIWGNDGDDFILGDRGDDHIDGGIGNDKYVFTTGDGQDVITDVAEATISSKGISFMNKNGSVFVNNLALKGGKWDETTESYTSLDTGVTYSWTGVNGNNLIINYGISDTVTVENFNNGDLGIQFDRSIEKDKDKLPDQLKKDKQNYADKVVSGEIIANSDTGAPSLIYEDTDGNQWNVINCETTSKITNAYGSIIQGAIVDTAGNYILNPIGQTLKLAQAPVDYNRLISNMKAIASGQEVKTVDLAIPPDVYVPTSSTGQPTLQDVYYQYTTQPSNNGFLAGLFTIAQIAICIGTGNFVGALLVGLETGIAGQTVGNITSMVDLATSVVNLGITSVKKLGAIFTNIGNNTGAAADLFKLGLKETDYSNLGFTSIAEINKSFAAGGMKISEHSAMDVLGGLGSKVGDTFTSLRLLNVLVNNPTSASNDQSYVFRYDPVTGNGSGAVPTNSNVFEVNVDESGEPVPYKLAVDKGCPLSLDMDNDGIETLDIDQTNIYFNTQNTLFSTKTGWLKGDDALLAVDKDGDGLITKQSELFGTEKTPGFTMLKDYDTNNDNVINASDTQFANLRVWQDANENGVTDAGELKSLSEAGITSIGLNTQDLSIEQNQNTITAQSIYTRSDGTTGDIFNVNFAFNKIYTKYTGNYELSLDVLNMPWIRGYGQVVDLQLGMTQDESLKALVEELSQMTDTREIYNRMDELLAKWTGSESIDPNAMSGSVNSRELAILNKFLNIGIEGIIPEDKKAFLDSSYTSLKNKIFVNLISQTSIGNAFEINYDYQADAILYNDNTYEKLVTNLANQNNFSASYIIAKVLDDASTLNGNKLAYAITEKGFGAQLLSYLNSGFQIKESGEIAYIDPNTPLYVIGTNGNDTITGTNNADIIYGMDGNDILNGGAGDDYLNGGNGNDTLIGGDGNDTLDGGAGNDSLYGGYGNDVYIYDGDGKDIVADERWVTVARQNWYQTGWWIFKHWEWEWVYQDQLVDAGNDTIVFGSDIKEKDVIISRVGNNLVFSLNGTNNKLTINNWYATTEQRVEKFVFADGLVINSSQIINYIKDTSGNDSIVTSDSDNFIVSGAGNDTVNGNRGDDAIVNYTGDTTYIFRSGDGDDVIMDYAGNDKIKFASGILSENVKFVRNNNDLIISVNNMTDTITVYNWFISDSNKIESLEFSNGAIISASSINSLISAQIATGYDDNIVGNDQDNLIDGLSGNDYLEGGIGNDTLVGGLGKDIMKGGVGNDSYYVDNAKDIIVENVNEGTDTAYSAISYKLADNVENLTLIGTGNISGEGNDLNNVITGNSGDNILAGGPGNDTLKGGLGNDIYIIDNLEDTIIENANEGIDTVQSSINYTLDNNVENLVLAGDSNINGAGNSLNNYITGNSKNNLIDGGAGNDTLYGGLGNDTLKGGIGDDTYIVDDKSSPTIIENANEGIDTVQSSFSYALGNTQIENLVLTGTSNVNATGNNFNNIIVGNSGNNTLTGGLGNDTLNGGAGSDTYVFNIGDGQDVINENDPVYGSIDKIVFGAGISQGNVTLTQSGYDLIVSINGTNDRIIIKNSNLEVGSRIERFEFANGSYIDGTSFYTMNGSNASETLNTGISYLTIPTKVDFKTSNTIKTYDEYDRLTSAIFYDNKGNSYLERYFTYSIGIYSPTSFNETRNTYDSNGRLIDQKNYSGSCAYVDNNGEVTFPTLSLYSQGSGTYDSNGRLSKITTYLANTTTIDTETNFAYDSYGNITRSETYQYEWSGYPATRVSRLKSYKSNIYDANGNITRSETYEGYWTEYPRTWVFHLKDYTNYTCDFNGNVTHLETYSGHWTGYPQAWVFDLSSSSSYTYSYSYGYDSNGRLASILTYMNGSSNPVGKVYYTYDTGGRLSFVDCYTGSTLIKSIKYEYSFDGEGRIIGQQIYKANINNGSISSYSKIQDNTLNIYYNNLIGYEGSDILNGGSQEDVLYGNGGNDTLQGYEGNDTLDGGAGSDLMVGGKGDDTYVVDSSADTIRENVNEGTDTVNSSITYTLNNTLENLTLIGTSSINGTGNNSDNILIGNNANNILTGGAGNDTLNGGIGVDTTVGGVGDDTYYVDNIGDVVTENSNEGTDTVNSSMTYTLGNNLENLTLIGTSLINGTGNTLNNIITGNAGNNIIDGGIGADTMIGGIGDDTYYVDSAYDVVIENENEGIDTVISSLSHTLSANIEKLTLVGLNATNATGNALNNVLIGNSANNIINGGSGSDTMIGSAGDDTYYVDNAADVITENANEGIDIVYSSVNYTLSNNVEKLVLSGTKAINGTGSESNNTITGNSLDNILDGGLGADTMIGGAGNDSYYIDNIGDAIIENINGGTDTVNSSISYTLVNNVENLTLIGNVAMNATGNELNNVIIGNSSNNIIDGDFGADTMIGGLGSDIYYVDDAGDIVTENANEGTDLIYSNIDYTLSNNVENLTLTGSNAINAAGNDLDNIITGNSADNFINSGAGNDTLDGGVGIDTMSGGLGNDIYCVDDYADVVIENTDVGIDTVISSISYTLGANVENLTLTGIESISGTGNELNNVIVGNSNSNIIYGNVGNDTMYGGDGNDIISDYSGNNYVDGGSGNDYITLTSTGNNTIYGGLGDDALKGGKGTNYVDGGEGNDTISTYSGSTNNISAGLGDDRIVLSRGTNFVDAGNGNDTITSAIMGNGITANNTINCGFGDDSIIAGSGIHYIDGGEGNDFISVSQLAGNYNNTLIGGIGNDTLAGGIDADTMIGGLGNDVYFVDNIGDLVTENSGEGIDTVNSSITYTLGANVENLILTGENNIDGTGNELGNIISGNNSINVLNGGVGNDTIYGNDGDDVISDIYGNNYVDGGNGSDYISITSSGFNTILGGTGDDDIKTGNNSTNYIDAGEGNDIIECADGNNTIYGGSGNDTISLYSGASYVEGGDGNDSISISQFAGVYNNTLIGGAGNDTIFGGVGADSLVGGDGDDTYQFTKGGGIDEIIDTYGNDILQFDSSVLKDDLYYLQSGNNLLVKNKTNSDEIVINNWCSLPDNRIERMLFSDGTFVDITTIDILDETIDEDNALTLNIFTQYNGQLTIASFTQGQNGIVSINAENELVYTPNANYNGTDSFAYSLSDGNGGTTTKTVNLKINSVNDIPTAVLASGITDEDNSIIFDVLAEANDEDLDTLTISEFTQGIHGVITKNQDNKLVYTPNANYNGTDSFNYTISDGNGGTVTKTVNMTINSVNDTPTAILTSAALNEDTSVILDVLTNASDVDGDTLTINSFTQAQNGSITLNQDNKLVYTPGIHYSGSDSFDYKISDGNGGIVTKTVNITVNPLPVNIVGTSGNDILTGNYKDNIVDGGVGADTMIGGLGNDTYYVDNAGDIVTENASEGTDAVNSSVTYTLGNNVENLTLTGTTAINGTGNTLDNYIAGNSAANTLSGGAGNDTLDGGAGADSLIGSTGNDSLYGGNGVDTLIGGADNDILDGGAGADSLIGGTGDDTYYVDNTGDIVVENANEGTDVVNSSITYTLTANVENLTLTGTSAINGTGNTLNNYILGNSANNNLSGGAGNDTLDGGTGADTLVGGTGNDTYYVDNTGDTITENASEGTDTACSSITYTLAANVENLTLTGTSVINGTGNTLNNIITGNAANNVIDGGTGVDTMIGGLGDDTYYVDNAGDVITENANEGIDKVKSSITYTLGANIENLTLTGTTAINGTGNTLDNYIIGNSAANTISGGTGNDTLDGGTGVDTMVGGVGNDTYYVDNAADVITENINEGIDAINSSVTYTLGVNVENLTLIGTTAINGTGNTLNNYIMGNSSANILTGGGGNDTIDSGASADSLVGGAGNDVLVGGTGNDTLIGGAGDDTYQFTKGDGIDEINDSLGNDVLQFDSSVSKDDLYYLQNVNNLLVKNKTNSDKIIIDNWYLSSDNKVEKMLFSDGTSVDINPLNNSINETIDEDNSLMLNVLDEYVGQLTIGSFTQGAHGSIIKNAENKLVYTPSVNYNGNDTFTYTLTDSNGGTVTKTVNLVINRVNDAPIATLTSGSLNEDTSLILDVLASASDVDGDILTINSFTQTQKGTLTLNEQNKFVYVPNANYHGTDLFTYTISDSNGGIATKTVNLTIDSVNDIPIATVNSGTLNEDNSLIIDVLAGSSDVDGDTLSISMFTQGSHGSVIKNTENKLVYSPNVNYNGTDSFAYTISDGNGGLITKTVDLTISPVNDNPVATLTSAILNEDTQIILDIIASASDVDGDILTINSFTQGLNGSIIKNTDNKLVYTPNSNYYGTDSFTYTLDDGNGGFITKTVNLTINSVNDVPTATLTSATLDEDSFAILDVLDSASDVDGDTLSISNFTQGTYGSVAKNQDNKLVYTPATDYSGADSFTYTISDAHGGLTIKTVNLEIIPLPVNFIGGSGNDILTGNSKNNIIDGGVGADTMIGGLGNDIYYVDNTNDVITENANEGIDTVNSSINYTLGNNVENLTLTGAAAINGTGNTLSNYIVGNSGANVLTGGAGNDTIDGGAGNNNYIFNLGDGNDNIIDAGYSTITFGAEITKSNIRFIASGSDIIISFNGYSDSITLKDKINVSFISSIVFADGTSYTASDIDSLLTVSSGIKGTTGNDSLSGTSSNDTIYGLDGSDTITPGSGNDLVYAGDGNDSIYDNSGSNTIYGGAGNDTIGGYGSSLYTDGGAGNDYIYGGTGNDTIYGGSGNDYINAGSGYNKLEGGDGNDTIIASSGNDTIFGGIGDDSLAGGGGSDTYIYNLGNGNDTISAGNNGKINFGTGITKDNLKFIGSSYDIIVKFTNSSDSIVIKNQLSDSYISILNFADGTNYTASQIAAMLEPVYGTDNNDSILGSYSNDAIYGLGGNDTITPGYGNDLVYAGDGNDSIYDNSGSDTFYGGAGADTLAGYGSSLYADGGDGNDYIYGSTGNDTIYGGTGNDYIYGNSGYNKLDGGDGNDTIIASSGNDTIFGGIGDDSLAGGGGSDTYIYNLGDGNDTILANNYGKITFGAGITQDNLKFIGKGTDLTIIFTNSTTDSILLTSQLSNSSISSLVFADNSILTASQMAALLQPVYGTDNNETIGGSYGNDTIYGLGGSDTVTSGYGNDLVYAGDGNDSIYDNSGNDTFYGGAGNDTIGGYGNSLYADGGDGNDYIYGSTGNDTIYGGVGNDYISGNSGYNKLDGGDGNDTIIAYGGNDTIYGGIGDDSLAGGGGSDTYIYNIGDGNDTVSAGNYGKITFGIGITKDNLKFTGRSTDILITFTNSTTDSILLTSQLSNSSISSLIFADNSILTASQIAAMLEPVVGTDNNETIGGSYGNDTIYGLGGSDTITPGYGNDLVYAGDGNDSIYDNSGYDTFYGGAGADTLAGYGSSLYADGGDGNDYIYGGTGNDAIYGGTGNDYISGNNGYNYLDSGDGNDTIISYGGNDTIYGGTGADSLAGGGGSDTYIYNIGDGNDTVSAGNYGKITFGTGITQDNLKFIGKGTDLTITFTNSTTDSILLTSQLSNSSISGLVFADNSILTASQIAAMLEPEYGTDSSETLVGSYGNDTIYGLGGSDTITPDNGNDLVYAGDGNDSIYDLYGNNTIYGGAGADTIIGYGSLYADGGDGNDSICGGNGNNTIYGGYGDDTLNGNSGYNYLDGGDGNDSIISYNGNDTIYGGKGNDYLAGGNGNDIYMLSSTNGNDTISDSGGSDKISLDSSISKNNIAVFMSGTNLVVDYGTTIGQDRIVVLGQTNSTTAVEKIQLSDGTYISNTDVNQLVQAMSTYASSHGLQFTSVNDVKNNQDLMTMVANSWHG